MRMPVRRHDSEGTRPTVTSETPMTTGTPGFYETLIIHHDAPPLWQLALVIVLALLAVWWLTRLVARRQIEAR